MGRVLFFQGRKGEGRLLVVPSWDGDSGLCLGRGARDPLFIVSGTLEGLFIVHCPLCSCARVCVGIVLCGLRRGLLFIVHCPFLMLNVCSLSIVLLCSGLRGYCSLWVETRSLVHCPLWMLTTLSCRIHAETSPSRLSARASHTTTRYSHLSNPLFPLARESSAYLLNQPFFFFSPFSSAMLELAMLEPDEEHDSDISSIASVNLLTLYACCCPLPPCAIRSDALVGF